MAATRIILARHQSPLSAVHQPSTPSRANTPTNAPTTTITFHPHIRRSRTHDRPTCHHTPRTDAPTNAQDTPARPLRSASKPRYRAAWLRPSADATAAHRASRSFGSPYISPLTLGCPTQAPTPERHHNPQDDRHSPHDESGGYSPASVGSPVTSAASAALTSAPL